MSWTVDILLATYNGAKYLPEQLRSIEEQTFREWKLLVRDDGSSDETREILRDFKVRHGSSVQIIEDSWGRLGIRGNFNLLLASSTASYTAFCDQDDVWRPEKLEILLSLARGKERENVPLLIHCDLEVVDSGLTTISHSLWVYQKIDPRNCSWSRLLMQNVVTGCACLFNASLRRAALPIPQAAIMHDWWVALVAAWSGGEIVWCSQPLIRYRQHGMNDTGAKKWGAVYLISHSPALFQSRSFQAKIATYRGQAEALLELPLKGTSGRDIETLQMFAHLDHLPRLGRVGFLLRNDVLKTGWLRNIALLLRI